MSTEPRRHTFTFTTVELVIYGVSFFVGMVFGNWLAHV